MGESGFELWNFMNVPGKDLSIILSCRLLRKNRVNNPPNAAKSISVCESQMLPCIPRKLLGFAPTAAQAKYSAIS
jgi:hypothetical protein